MTKLYQGDCLEIMKDLPDKSIDMVLCDLPYGTTACKWDTVIPFEPLWEHYKRVIKDNGAIVLFSAQPFTSDVINSNRKLFRYDLIWHKNMGSGFANSNKMPMRYHENICVFYKTLPTYNPQFQEYSNLTKKRYKDGDTVKNINTKNKNSVYREMNRVDHPLLLSRGKYPESVLKINCVPNCNGTKFHPTQKPVALLEYLIKTYTLEGETALDNTMGSGSTGVACVNTNRNFVGIEKDHDYFCIAEKRIAEAQEARKTLFTESGL